MKQLHLLSFLLLVLSCSSQVRPQLNQYPGFDPKQETYSQYSNNINRSYHLTSGEISKSIVCPLIQGGDSLDVVQLNPNQEIHTKFYTDDSLLIDTTLVVGENLGPGFECMGACGPGCPTFGIPIAFTEDCLNHDLCVYQYGIQPEIKREEHPQCGRLYLQAIDDWCEYGHFFLDD